MTKSTFSPYTLIACAITAAFFYQPFEVRQSVWKAIIDRWGNEPTRLFWVGSMLIHTGAFVVANLVMTAIYYMNHPYFEQFKCEKHVPWPWQKEQTRSEYFALVRKSLVLLCFNTLILSPFLMAQNFPLYVAMGTKWDVESLPPFYVNVFQISCFMVIEDCLFYWLHRFLHWGKIYGYIHKIHHQYKHTIGIAAEYAHPLEFVISNGLPFTVGPLVFGAHLSTIWMWLLLRIGETVDGHCGYEFPWSPYRLLPFSGSSSVHNFHHSHNVGNYASFFTWWDQLCGTDAAYVKHESKLRLEEERQQQIQNGKKME